MRPELFYDPCVLLERCSEELTKRSRLRRLRSTCAQWLGNDHVDSLELIELGAKAGARVFYDVGANVGTWTLLCRALVPSSTIVAFEPMTLRRVVDSPLICGESFRTIDLTSKALPPNSPPGFLCLTSESASALEISHWLARDPRVEWVSYPGLDTHPEHAEATKYLTGGFGGVLTLAGA